MIPPLDTSKPIEREFVGLCFRVIVEIEESGSASPHWETMRLVSWDGKVIRPGVQSALEIGSDSDDWATTKSAMAAIAGAVSPDDVIHPKTGQVLLEDVAKWLLASEGKDFLSWVIQERDEADPEDWVWGQDDEDLSCARGGEAVA